MKSAVIVFPGSNCDRDAQTALRQVTGGDPAMVARQEDFRDRPALEILWPAPEFRILSRWQLF